MWENTTVILILHDFIIYAKNLDDTFKQYVLRE